MAVFRTKDGALTERVATLLLGAPSGGNPDKGIIRFGDVTVNLATGRFFDMEDEEGGDHLGLIRKFKRLENGQAEAWLEENILKARKFLEPEYESERMLLGMLASQPRLVDAVLEDVTEDHFGLPAHKALFASIVAYAADVADATPMPIPRMVEAWGGDMLAPVMGADGYTAATYVGTLIARAPDAPDAAHMARSLAVKIRSDANRGTEDEHGDDLEPEPEPFKSQYGGFRFEELDEPGPEHEHVIDGLITVGDRSVIGGASRSGKSFLAIHAAGCIATGMAFFGRKVLKPGLVVYQAGEGARGIKKRFRAWRQYFDAGKGKVPIFILPSKIDIHAPDGDTAKLIQELAGIEQMYGKEIVALFVDTLAKAAGTADENSGKDMGTVMNNVDKIADAFPGMHVCLVHHMNAGGTKLRGHTSVAAGVDQVILVARDEKIPRLRTAVLDKQKDEEDGASINFELLTVTIGHRQVDNAPITSCVVLPAGAEVNHAATRETITLSDDQANILSALKTALAEKGIATPRELKLPKSVPTVCRVNDWYEAYRAVSSKEEGAIKTAMSRASDKFVKLRIIGRVNPFVWVTGRAVAVPKSNFEGDPSSAEIQQEFPET